MINGAGALAPDSSFEVQRTKGCQEPGGVMAEVPMRTRAVASKVFDELKEMIPKAQASSELEKSWPMMEPFLEKYLNTVQFEHLIDLLIDVTQFCPQMKLSLRIINYLCINFKLNQEHPLRAVYVLIYHVDGPTFLQIMRLTGLPLIAKNNSSWSFLDEDKDSSGVSHWLNVHVCAALNSISHIYATPQSWVDIALFNVCRRHIFLSFRMQTSESSKLYIVLERLYQRLPHSALKEIKQELLQAHDQVSCCEVLEAAPHFFYMGDFCTHAVQSLIKDALKMECTSNIWTFLAELAKMDKLPPPPIEAPSKQIFFNFILMHLKPQSLETRRRILYALLTLVEKKYNNASNLKSAKEFSGHEWHMCKLSKDARISLRNFFIEPESGKLYRFETEDFPSILHFFELMHKRKGVIFNIAEINKYKQTLQKNLDTDFIN